LVKQKVFSWNLVTNTPIILITIVYDHRSLLEIDTNVTILVLGSLMAIIGGIGWGKWLSVRGGDPSIADEKIKSYKDQAAYWRGVVGQSRAKFKVDGDYNLDNPNDVVSLTNNITPGLLEILPKDVQDKAKGLLKNPDVIDLLQEIYKQYPGEIKELLGGFMKGKAGSTSEPGQLSQDKIAELGAA